MERGEVYYIRYDNTIGFEQAVGRPALVVSSEEGIKTSPVVQIVFLTTSPRETGICVEVNSLSRRSWAICNQLNTVDKSRLDKKTGKLTYTEMKKVDERLLEVLGLKNELKCVEGKAVETETNTEIAELKVELAVHKALYEKTLEKLIELRLEKDGVTEKVEAPKPKVVEQPKDEPKLDLSALEEKFKVHDEKKAQVQKKVVAPASGVRAGGATLIDIGRKLNINTATYEDFRSIGMGEGISKKIIRYRNKYGKFKSLEDLRKVPAFGAGCYGVYTPGLTV